MEYTTSPELRELILHSIKNTAGKPNEWFCLTQVRQMPLLRNVKREIFDRALMEMFGNRAITLIPESNQKMLKPADREAAVWIGGQYLHHAAHPDNH